MTDIESALKRLQKEADKGRHLFHATRILFGPSPTAEEARSGTDPATGWEPFLGPVEVFESHEYDRGGRWQQGCYVGDDGLLAEYTAVATALGVLLCDARAIPVADRRDPRAARDAWTFATYAVGVEEWGAFQIDAEEEEPFAGSVVEGLADMIAGSRATVEQDLSLLDRYRTGFRNKRSEHPHRLFARLRVDLITATRRLIERMHDRWEDYYPAPLDRARGLQFKVNVPGPSSALSAGGKVRGQNEERDRWLFDLCCRGVPYADIRHQLEKRVAAAHKDTAEAWETIDSIEGIRLAALRYAERHELAPPPARKKGKRTPR